MRRVVIESPYAGSGLWPLSTFRRWSNIRYARRCVRDSILRGESPLASHLLYTQPGILRDRDPEERRIGIEAGLAWAAVADAHIFYIDHGFSPGMKKAYEYLSTRGGWMETRRIDRKAE